MKVVLDTNCFISCIGKKSKYRKVFDSFLNAEYTLCFSTEILFEYEEKFLIHWGEEVTHNLLGTLLTSSNISLHSVYYNFLLVKEDADDNKFADVYLSSNADLLVTNDRLLLSLNQNEYPPVKAVSLQDFMLILEKNK